MKKVNGNLIELVCNTCGTKVHKHAYDVLAESFFGWLFIGNFHLCPDCVKKENDKEKEEEE